jgi:hypothetical protein
LELGLSPWTFAIARPRSRRSWPGIFERLGCTAQSRHNRMQKLNEGTLLGRFFASTRAKLREIADRLRVRYVVNLTGCPGR